MYIMNTMFEKYEKRLKGEKKKNTCNYHYPSKTYFMKSSVCAVLKIVKGPRNHLRYFFKDFK